jgi:hypothetical protein|tara:strand:- start:321 stop:593 length:273 start_codon:yes stop_codon:yes gene_type:complete
MLSIFGFVRRNLVMITRKEFTEQVEKLLVGNRTDIMSAILKVCEINGVEPEGAKRLLSVPLKEKLTAEAEKLKLINREKASRGSLESFIS